MFDIDFFKKSLSLKKRICNRSLSINEAEAIEQKIEKLMKFVINQK